MDFRQCTLVKEIYKPFSKEIGEKLLENRNYLYFSLRVKLKSKQSFVAMMAFMDEIEICLEHQFEQVYISMAPGYLKICNQFLEKYIEKGFLKKAIFFEYLPAMDVMERAKEDLRYINNDIFDSFVRVRERPHEHLLKSKEIETFYLPKTPSLLYKYLKIQNYHSLSIRLSKLTQSFFSNIPDSSFRNPSCETLYLYLTKKEEEYSKDVSVKEQLEFVKRLSQLLVHFPNIHTLHLKKLKCWNFLTKNYFFQKPPNSPNLPNPSDFTNLTGIKELTSDANISDEFISLHYKAKIVKLFCKKSKKNCSFSVTVRDFEIKLRQDEFKVDCRRGCVVVIDEPSWYSFKNVGPIEELEISGKHKGMPVNKIYFEIGHQILTPKKKVEEFFNKISYGKGITTPITIYKNIFTSQIPHYEFNLFSPPSPTPTPTPTSKITYSPLLTTLPTLPTSSPISINISSYYSCTFWERFPFYTIYPPNLLADQSSVTFEKEIIKETSPKELGELLDLLEGKNLREFRSEVVITGEGVVEKFCELCECNGNIRDIEVRLESAKDVKRVLEALEGNYVVKTVRLMSEERIKVPGKVVVRKKKGKRKKKEESKGDIEKMEMYAEILGFCEEFRRRRVGTEIVLNTQEPKFQPPNKKGFSLHYKVGI